MTTPTTPETIPAKVRVFHTTDLRAAYFEPTRQAIEVFQYVSNWDDPQDVCTEALELFNIAADYVAAAYWGRRNRNFGTGDLVMVGDEVYECRQDGFERREKLPELIEENRYGSTWFHGRIPTDEEVKELALREVD